MQIVERIGADAQLRKDKQIHIRRIGPAGLFQYPVDVEGYIGRPHAR